MCLVAFAYRTDPRYELALIANRDESFKRPSEPARFWTDAPSVLAGRDLAGGGTWMGVTRDGRFALLTNYRDPSRIRPNAKSRGLLVSEFLKGDMPANEYLETLRLNVGEFNDFNLLAGSPDGIFYLSSLNAGTGGENGVREVSPGLYGMSNHLFETPWPKVIRAREGLKHALAQGGPRVSKDGLFEILADSTPAPDDRLPETGVGLEWERALSSIFITMPGYGTHSSTLLLIDKEGGIEFSERTFSEDRKKAPITADFHFSLQP